MLLSIAQTTSQIMHSPYQSALDLYGFSPKISVDVPLRGKKFCVPAALVDEDCLESIMVGEKYACTIGGMFFITNNTPTDWRRYPAFHELAEHAALRGFNITGLAAHYQALTLELGYAKATLPSSEYEIFLDWRKKVERSKFFRLDDCGLVDEASERITEVFEILTPYITYKRKQLVDFVVE